MVLKLCFHHQCNTSKDDQVQRDFQTRRRSEKPIKPIIVAIIVAIIEAIRIITVAVAIIVIGSFVEGEIIAVIGAIHVDAYFALALVAIAITADAIAITANVVAFAVAIMAITIIEQ